MLNPDEGGMIRDAYFFIKVPRFNVITSHFLIIPAILVNCWQVFKISHEVVKYVDAGTKDNINLITPETQENMTRCLQSNLDDMKRDNGLFGKR